MLIRKAIRKVMYALNGKTITVNHQKLFLIKELLQFYSLRHNNVLEPDLSRFVQSLLQPGDIFVDIGANIGIITLFASKKVGKQGQVIAFEPNPKIFSYLIEMLQVNEAWMNVIAIPVAMSNQPGVLKLSMNHSDSKLMERSSLVKKDSQSVDVDVLVSSLDILLPSHISPKIIKIDVEGAELDVLQGSVLALKHHQPIVCIEIHGLYFEDYIQFVRNVFDFFASVNYSGFNLIKKKREDWNSFIKDTGVAGKEPQTRRPFSQFGYGNMVFVAEKYWCEVNEYFSK